MSQLYVDNIRNRTGGPIGIPTGAVVTGVITATTANVTGNMTVGGVLTYEDVTNIDSVGIITARSDVSIADKIVHTGDTNTAIRFPAADTFSIETAGTEALRVDSSGRLLVGVTTTAFANDVNFQITDNTNAKFLLRNPSYGTFSLAVTNDSVLALKDEANAAERLRIDSSGRLLLGATVEGEPNADNLTLADSGTCGITIRSGSSNFGTIYFSDATSGNGEYDGYIDYNHSNSTLRFGTGATTRVTVDSTGVTVTGAITVSDGANLNGYKVEEGDIETTSLNGEFDYNLENGHIQKFTGATGGNYQPDFKVNGSTSLSSIMDVGDVVTCTLMVASSSHYLASASIKIDDSASNLDIDNVGGSAPSAANGSGYDIYTFTIQKTAATPSYHIVVNTLGAN